MQSPDNITLYRHDLRDKILHVASDMFLKRGIRQVRMDDIAKELSISKRTLYEIYEDKEHLLLDVIKNRKEEHDKSLSELMQGNADAMEIILKFYHIQMKEFSSVNSQFFSDLTMYDDIVDYWRAERQKNADGRQKFIQKAIDEGFFIRDVNYNFIFRIMEAMSDYIIANDLYKEYGLKTVFHNFIMIFLRGICTPKGMKRFDELMLNINN